MRSHTIFDSRRVLLPAIVDTYAASKSSGVERTYVVRFR